MAFKKEENKNKDDFIPMRKAIAIILTVITTVVGLFGVGIFFGMKTMDTKPVLQEQNVTQIPSNEKKNARHYTTIYFIL